MYFDTQYGFEKGPKFVSNNVKGYKTLHPFRYRTAWIWERLDQIQTPNTIETDVTKSIKTTHKSLIVLDLDRLQPVKITSDRTF